MFMEDTYCRLAGWQAAGSPVMPNVVDAIYIEACGQIYGSSPFISCSGRADLHAAAGADDDSIDIARCYVSYGEKARSCDAARHCPLASACLAVLNTDNTC